MVQVVRKAYLSSEKVNMHELRALAASWTYNSHVTLEDVLSVAFWWSSGFSRDCYLRDLALIVWAMTLLRPVVAAQHVCGRWSFFPPFWHYLASVALMKDYLVYSRYLSCIMHRIIVIWDHLPVHPSWCWQGSEPNWGCDVAQGHCTVREEQWTGKNVEIQDLTLWFRLASTTNVDVVFIDPMQKYTCYKPGNFGLCCSNSSPQLAKNLWRWLKFMVSNNYPENLLLDRLQTWNLQKWFTFGVHWPNFSYLLPKIDWKLWFLTII